MKFFTKLSFNNINNIENEQKWPIVKSTPKKKNWKISTPWYVLSKNGPFLNPIWIPTQSTMGFQNMKRKKNNSLYSLQNPVFSRFLSSTPLAHPQRSLNLLITPPTLCTPLDRATQIAFNEKEFSPLALFVLKQSWKE